MQDFTVTAVLTKTAQFVIEARTPEEAVSIAENWIADGEFGVETLAGIEDIEAVRCDEGPAGEILPADQLVVEGVLLG